jgi:subtilisin family serine protease
MALSLAVTALPGGAASAHPATPAKGWVPQGTAADWVPGHVVMKLRPGAALPTALLQRYGLEAQPAGGGMVLLQGRSDLDIAAAAEALRAEGAVAFAEPDYQVHMDLTPNDTRYADQQWWLNAIQAPAAWDISTGNPDLVVAIMDTGVATDHPEFAGRILGGHNFVRNNDDPYDDNGHGTHVAGIAAAMGNNGIGIAGIAWNVKILPVKVMDDQGRGSTFAFTEGIRWAADHGARVINISAGADFGTDAEHDAVVYARSKGVVIVAAAGNAPDGHPHYPAGYDEVIAVGATSIRDAPTNFSSYGDYVDVAAPGVNILSTFVRNRETGYESESGTSMASPVVAGAAALILSVNPNLNPEQVQLLLEQTSDDIGDPGFDQKAGWGRLNLLRALQQAPAGPKAGGPGPGPKPPPGKTGGSKVQGMVTGVDPALVDVLLLPQNGQPPRDIRPDVTGLYIFDNLPAGKYTVQLAIKSGAFDFPAPQTVEVNGNGDSVGFANFTLAVRRPVAFTGVPDPGSVAEGIYFPPVQHTLRGPFYTYWQAHGGLPIFGYPISEEFQEVSATDGKTYTVQYFQRNRFEYHPEFAGSPNEVLLGLLGVEITKGRTFAAGAPGPTDATHQWFPPVQHNLGGSFLAYWQSHGGLAVFGYPISEEFQEVNATDGKTYTVQYFQRNRFEYHPEFAGTPNEVLLGLLGVDVVKAKGWIQ